MMTLANSLQKADIDASQIDNIKNFFKWFNS
jgi:hypothetical protein